MITINLLPPPASLSILISPKQVPQIQAVQQPVTEFPQRRQPASMWCGLDLLKKLMRRAAHVTSGEKRVSDLISDVHEADHVDETGHHPTQALRHLVDWKTQSLRDRIDYWHAMFGITAQKEELPPVRTLIAATDVPEKWGIPMGDGVLEPTSEYFLDLAKSRTVVMKKSLYYLPSGESLLVTTDTAFPGYHKLWCPEKDANYNGAYHSFDALPQEVQTLLNKQDSDMSYYSIKSDAWDIPELHYHPDQDMLTSHDAKSQLRLCDVELGGIDNVLKLVGAYIAGLDSLVLNYFNTLVIEDDFEEYAQGLELQSLGEGREGEAFLIEKPLRLVVKRMHSPELTHDHAMHLLRKQFVLEMMGFDNVKVARIYGVGSDFIVRDYVPHQIKDLSRSEDIAAFRKRIAQVSIVFKSFDWPEIETIIDSLEKAWRAIFEDLGGSNVGHDNKGNIILYDPDPLQRLSLHRRALLLSNTETEYSAETLLDFEIDTEFLMYPFLRSEIPEPLQKLMMGYVENSERGFGVLLHQFSSDQHLQLQEALKKSEQGISPEVCIVWLNWLGLFEKRLIDEPVPEINFLEGLLASEKSLIREYSLRPDSLKITEIG
jgi:hypothetical protein